MKMKNQKVINETLLEESIFFVGKVTLIRGREVEILVEKDKNLSHLFYKNKINKNISVGSYIKICKGFIRIVGKITGESVRKKEQNKDYKQEKEEAERILNVSLYGYFEEDDLKQGIKEMPLVDNECYLLNHDEFNQLHRFYDNEEGAIEIGGLSEEPLQKIKLSINRLFAGHIGIFGNTGSGKSNTLAKIYSELFKKIEKSKNKSKFTLIDFNGEYSTKEEIITKNKIVYDFESNKYPVGYEDVFEIENLSILLDATKKTQRPFLRRVIKRFDKNISAYYHYNYNSVIRDSVEIVLRNGNIDLRDSLLQILSSLNINNYLNLNNVLKKIDQLNYNPTKNAYYVGEKFSNGNLSGVMKFLFKDMVNKETEQNMVNKETEQTGIIYFFKFLMFAQYLEESARGFIVSDHIKPLIMRTNKQFELLSRYIDLELVNNRDQGGTKILEVINLKDVEFEIKNFIALMICQKLYKEKKDSKDSSDKKTSLHIIIDEAHNILSSIKKSEDDTWKDYTLDIFKSIIKEGRKFDTFLTIASQRPQDIDVTILSQLHTYFIHRLINSNDINSIQKSMAYLDKLSFESIPVLPIGSCFLSGLSSDIPVQVDIEMLEEKERPDSSNIDLEEVWLKN